MRIIVSFIMLLIIAVFSFLMYLYSEVRFDAYKIINYAPKLSTQIFDRNGQLVANIFDKEHRLYVKFENIPPRVIEALVAIEDTAFFEHRGINLEAIFRAAIKDIKAMKFVEGASTITQQLVKNALLTRDKKIIRKLKEIVLALKVESELSKEQILERYLNQVYFGHGYYGIKTAALGYFHKSLDELSIKEIAMLVGLPRAPSSYDPTRHLDLSLSRANRVLFRMSSLGWINDDELSQAQNERPLIFDETLTLNKAPYVVDEVIKRTFKEFEDIKKGGYKIYLSIDLKLQNIAREALKHGYEGILSRNKDANTSLLNGGFVAMENSTGEVLSLVGGIDYAQSNFNRAIQSKRQPGSSFKPFIYQNALDIGYSSLSKIPDISRTYTNKEKEKDWKPRNYEEDYEGLIDLDEALIHSRNLATINLVNKLGLDTLYRRLRAIGLEEIPYDLSIALGSFGISPLEFSGFYSIFSNYGEKVEPILIKKISNRFGNERVYETQRKKVTSPEQAYLMIDILKKVVKRGTGRNARIKDLEIAGKTGTTNNNIDAWFCGFSPDIEVIVWYGNDDNTPMKRRETGGRAAAPAFRYFFERYLKLHPETTREFKKPKDVKEIKIDGKLRYFTDISQPPKKKVVNDEENELIF